MIKLPDTDGLHETGRLGDPTGPGPRLRAAREANGYEIEDIAKQLRLHPCVIQDLECDKFPDHLALVFVRGYLRSYAGLIGLDPDEIVEEFNAMGYKEDRDLPDLKGKTTNTRMRNGQDMYKSRSRSGFRWAAAGVVTVALGALFVAFNYEPQEQIYPSPMPTEVSQAPAPTVEAANLPADPHAAPAPEAQAAPAPAAVVQPPSKTVAPAPGASKPMARQAPPPPQDDDEDDEPNLPRPGQAY